MPALSFANTNAVTTAPSAFPSSLLWTSISRIFCFRPLKLFFLRKRALYSLPEINARPPVRKLRSSGMRSEKNLIISSSTSSSLLAASAARCSIWTIRSFSSDKACKSGSAGASAILVLPVRRTQYSLYLPAPGRWVGVLLSPETMMRSDQATGVTCQPFAGPHLSYIGGGSESTRDSPDGWLLGGG
jgi:hypothetical protein